MGAPSFSLEGRIAIVTGAAGVKGMGRATALTFAEAGADVAVCDIIVKEEDWDLEGTAEEIRKLGRRSLAVQADVTKESDVTSLVDKVVKEFGTIDIMANVAGASAHETLQNLTPDLWDKAMNVNLKSVYLCCQAVSKIMIERQSGNIINWASISGLMAAGASVYGIAKQGISVLTRWVAFELAPYNIRVNALAPGGVASDFGRHRIGRPLWEVSGSGQPRTAGPQQTTPQPSTGLVGVSEPSDIANVALFLASDASRKITGQTIIVDGGTSLGVRRT